MPLAAVSAPAEVLQYIQALKWPFVVLLGLFVERRAISSFLERFRMPDEGSAKLVGVGEMTWRNRVNTVAEILDEVTTREKPVIEQPIRSDSGSGTEEARITVVGSDTGNAGNQWDGIDRLVLTDPTGAVILAWERLQETLMARAYIEKANVSISESRNPLLVATRLGLPDEIIQIIGQLRILRNTVAHGQQRVTSEDALEYVQTVKRASEAILPGY